MTPVADILPKIGAPATRALHDQGILNLEDLRQYTRQQIADLHGIGPKALGILEAAMKKQKLSFLKNRM